MNSKHIETSHNLSGDSIRDMDNEFFIKLETNYTTLIHVISKMLCTDVLNATFHAKQLQGGTVGNVQLITGIAHTKTGNSNYSVVLKTQKKWNRHGDADSWRREYDLYLSGLNKFFTDELRWPECYYAQLHEDQTQLWMEYIEGVSGNKLTVDMCVQAAKALGQFQGKLHALKPTFIQSITNVSDVDYVKVEYMRYRSWDQVYDYIRSDNCPLPNHLCNMLIHLDSHWDSIWNKINKLPIVFCHRDFWIANLLYSNNKLCLIDWDTAGWGFMGEDIASLISDEMGINYMVETYLRCVPAYYKGFSEHVDISSITDNCIYELILIMFGYRLIEGYRFSESKEDKDLHLNTLEKIFEINIKSKNLQSYGFTLAMFTDGLGGIPARVIAVHKKRYEIICQYGQIFAILKSGTYYNVQPDYLPTTGDFVKIQYNDSGDSLIIQTLDRKSKFSRNDFSGHAVGYVKTIKEQIVASNFDYVFIMASLNHDFNLKRIERYLTLAWESGGIPVIILTKSDLLDDISHQVTVIQQVSGDVPIHAISSITGQGIDELKDYTQTGKTIVLLGSSGVGKSSLVNSLVKKDLMAVKEIRETDSRGRHTTTHRELIVLPDGGMIIDTPGMRELGMWHVTDGLNEAFPDVEIHLGKCKFSDCKHTNEPGCAIKKAIQNGTFSEDRWNSYLHIQSEARFVNSKSQQLRNKNSKNKHTRSKRNL